MKSQNSERKKCRVLLKKIIISMHVTLQTSTVNLLSDRFSDPVSLCFLCGFIGCSICLDLLQLILTRSVQTSSVSQLPTTISREHTSEVLNVRLNKHKHLNLRRRESYSQMAPSFRLMDSLSQSVKSRCGRQDSLDTH